MSDIYLSLTETPSVVTLSQPVISGALSSTVTVANTVTVALDANSLSALENVTVTVGAAVSVSNFPVTQVVSGTVTANTGLSQPLTDAQLRAAAVSVSLATLPASTVTVSNSTGLSDAVISGLQNAFGNSGTIKVDIRTPDGSVLDGEASVPVQGTVDIGSLPAISGTVTANVPLSVDSWNAVTGLRVLGTAINSSHRIQGLQVGTINSAIFEEGGAIPICGMKSDGSTFALTSVTVGAMPSGALTTRFGSVTTASVAQLTGAVTNSSRKYLLVQNIATSTVTIGIGFAPTTTQGIQLTAGAGLTFDAFCPTGGVWWLSSTTGSNFSILEG